MISPETSPEFEALLEYLQKNCGCDLTGYKRATLIRRFQYRMQSIKIGSYRQYLEYLQTHPEEWRPLLNDVLINFTSFFRDREAWDYLAQDIIPKIIANKQPDEPIRMWSAGCATGQEVYSLLMLFAEALGIESCLERVRCYATDADKDALRLARLGIYSDTEIVDTPPKFLEKYFQQTEQGYRFHRELRRTILFCHHDLVKDAPISKVDLLACRNVLIYFNPNIQASICTRFHFALKNTGFLFLGRSETIMNHRSIFTPINLQQRVYVKGLGLDVEDHLSIIAQPSRKPEKRPEKFYAYFWQTAFEMSPIAQLAVDLQGRLISANDQANFLFGLTLADLNRPLQELAPGKLIGSYTAICIIHKRNCSMFSRRNVLWSTPEGIRYFDIAIAPVLDVNQRLLGSTFTFIETTDCQPRSDRLSP